MDPTIKLSLKTRESVAPASELEVELTQLVSEEIEAGPSDAYPGGSGICAYLRFYDGYGIEEDAELCQLPPAYGSQLDAYFHGHRFHWHDVQPNGSEVWLELEVHKVAAEEWQDLGEKLLKRDVPTKIDDDLTVTFVAHSHKRTHVGQTSPLLVHLTYKREHHEHDISRSERLFSRDPARTSWYFERYRFEMVDHDYGEWMKVKVQLAR